MSRTVPLSYGAMAQDLQVNGGFAINPATTTGLTLGYLGCDFSYGITEVEAAAGTVALTDDTTNYVKVSRSNGAVTAYTVNEADTALAHLYTVTTASGVITGITDYRSVPV